MQGSMKTVVCLASGTSLTQEDVDYCKGKAKIYAVNECWALAPYADVLYAADIDWWDNYDGVPDFKGEKWTVNEAAAKKYGLNCVKYNGKLKWGEGDIIATGGNSGFQAINLAVMHGAQKVILLGYDMGFKNRKHWWTGKMSMKERPSQYNDWIKRFNEAQPLIPVPVINCTRSTALECFKRSVITDEL